jgi:hypothetical protein
VLDSNREPTVGQRLEKGESVRDTEPRADRGPHAGNPRGVVVATGCYHSTCARFGIGVFQNRER